MATSRGGPRRSWAKGPRTYQPWAQPKVPNPRYDGLFVLRHDTGLDPVTFAHAFKMFLMVVDTFSTAKTILETRPVFHKRDQTIRGHVFCSFLALCLKRELQISIEK